MPATAKLTRSAAQAIADDINEMRGTSMSGRRVPANLDGTVSTMSYNGAGGAHHERPALGEQTMMLTVPWANQERVTVTDVASAAGSTQPCGLCDPANPYRPAGRCPECDDSGVIPAWTREA